ncbi:MAG: cytochrome c biogenesis protein CcdA [Candidatus Levyibacteriota bacterium]
METVLFQTSLIAAFFAGIVALFAPCCISFLLPAYLGSVFKEKQKVLLMTLIYGLGIFVTLFPAVIGISLISKYLFRFHDTVYYLGGLMLILVSVITFLGIKMPMPSISRNQKQGKVDAGSIFVLGIFSGITSACCAPVLIGILTFAFLSPSFVGATLIGMSYVLGMVTPLLLISLLLNGKIDKIRALRKPVSSINLLGKTYTILLANLIAAAIFFTTGIFTLVLNYLGKFSMVKSEHFTKNIQDAAGYAGGFFGGNIYINIIFFAILAAFVYLLIKKV